MPTYKMTLEYEGTRYSGWQAQGNTPKTVQGRLISAARQIAGEAAIGGAGRTDAGVHAAGQVAHLRVVKKLDTREFTHKLNDLLPHDIHVLEIVPASDRFDARHDAESRAYLYQISRRRTAFAKPFVWWIKDSLDVRKMQAGASELVGKHDFAAFTDQRNKSESTLVVVQRVELEEDGDLILIRIVASHFLWKMVRKLVAALVEVGRGSMSVSQFVSSVKEPGDPFRPTAPPSGLFLEAVSYGNDVFDRALKPLVPVLPVLLVLPSPGRVARGGRRS